MNPETSCLRDVADLLWTDAAAANWTNTDRRGPDYAYLTAAAIAFERLCGETCFDSAEVSR